MILKIIVAVVFHVLDMAFGLVGAIRNKEKIKSQIMRDGFFKKMGFIGCYALCCLIQWGAPIIGLPIKIEVLTPVVCWCVMIEIISIIENLCKINPELSKSKLSQLLGINKEE